MLAYFRFNLATRLSSCSLSFVPTASVPVVLNIVCKLQAEVLGYVSAHRAISPELLRPLDLHSKRSSSFSMGASCSKSSSVGLSSKANEDLRSSTQSISSPYLVSNFSSSKLSKLARPVDGATASSSDLIQAQHQADPAGQLQDALAASAAAAVLSEASDRAAAAVAADALPKPPQQPSIAQQSLIEASAVYNRPLDRPAYHHRTASGKRRTGSLISQAPFPQALDVVVQRPSQEGFTQLLQQHLFESQDMKASSTFIHFTRLNPQRSAQNVPQFLSWQLGG